MYLENYENVRQNILVRIQSKNGVSGLRSAVFLHFVIEDFRLSSRRTWEQMFVQNSEDISADVFQFLFDLRSVLADHLQLSLGAFVLLLLFDARYYSPRRPSRADYIFVGDRKEIPLLDGQLHVQRGNLLHRLDHFCKITPASPSTKVSLS